MRNKHGKYFDPDKPLSEENNPFKHMNNETDVEQQEAAI